MSQRALITGITGMVGSHLADFLLANTNWEIHGMCRWRSPMDNVDHLVGKANRGDVFAESTFAKQIAMAEVGMIPPVIKTGNLESLRTWADVRDAVRAYHMLVTINPTPGEFYNIGGTHVCTVRAMLDFLIDLSTIKDKLTVVTDPDRLRPIDADLQVPDTTKFHNHTGWKPEISFEKTMTDLLNYWRERVKDGRSFLAR